MSRIAARFAALEARKRTALIPFVTAGDPPPAPRFRSCMRWWRRVPISSSWEYRSPTRWRMAR